MKTKTRKAWALNANCCLPLDSYNDLLRQCIAHGNPKIFFFSEMLGFATGICRIGNQPDISSRYDVLLSHNDSHHSDENASGCKQYDRVRGLGLRGGQSPKCRKLEIRQQPFYSAFRTKEEPL